MDSLLRTLVMIRPEKSANASTSSWGGALFSGNAVDEIAHGNSCSMSYAWLWKCILHTLYHTAVPQVGARRRTTEVDRWGMWFCAWVIMVWLVRGWLDSLWPWVCSPRFVYWRDAWISLAGGGIVFNRVAMRDRHSHAELFGRRAVVSR